MVDGDERTVAVLSEMRLAVHLGDRTWMADIVAVPCLKDRVRPLLKCPRAHEGNFQSLYWRGGELACRHCHALRYRSNLAPSRVARVQLAREKVLNKLQPSTTTIVPTRKSGSHKKRYLQRIANLGNLNKIYYEAIARRLQLRTRMN